MRSLALGVGERTPRFRTNRSDPPESCQHKARRVEKSAAAIRRRGIRRNEMAERKGETRLAIRGINLDSFGEGKKVIRGSAGQRGGCD